MEVICLDTDILIQHKRAKSVDKHKTRLAVLAGNGYHFAVTTITVYELFRGDNSDEDKHWRSFFSRVRVLDFDFAAAEIASHIYKDLKSNPIATEDLLIAAIAIKNNGASRSQLIVSICWPLSGINGQKAA
jgi:tRNA(fMet)-specific endonuclease VapC